MKLQDLNQDELNSVTGGSDSKSSIGIQGTIGADSLLTLHTESSNGDEYRSSTTSVGNDVYIDLGGVVNNISH
ncbi:MAG: hypothetical protein V4687_12535 [Bacteroidota bacterium]